MNDHMSIRRWLRAESTAGRLTFWAAAFATGLITGLLVVAAVR